MSTKSQSRRSDRRAAGTGARSLVRALLVPSAVSALVHLALMALLASVTWTIATSGDGSDRVGGEVVLDLGVLEEADPEERAESSAEVPALTGSGRARSSPSPPPVPSGDALEPTNAVAVPRLDESPARRRAPDATLSGVARDRPGRISFAGVRAQRASSVVFVVDASGAMASSLPLVIEELKRTIGRLEPEVRFQVVVFRDRAGLRDGGEPVEVLPAARGGAGLRAATPVNKAAAGEWLDGIFPSGRSNPLAGLERAFSFEERPELVMLLGRSIRRTEDATWGVGKRAILRRLDELNPPGRSGVRPTTIRAIQFLDDDPTGIMQEVAMRHGGGLHAYSIRTVEDLVSAGQRPDPEVELGRRLDEALAALAALSGDVADLAVLYGIATEDQRARAVEAATRIERLIEPALEQGDPLATALMLRARVLRAAGSGRPSVLSTVMRADRDDRLDSPIAWQRHVHELLAAMIREDAGDAGRSLATAFERALEGAPSGVSALARFEVALALVRVASDGVARDAAAARARVMLGEPPLGEPGRIDPALALVLADAAALSEAGRVERSDPSSARRVFEPYLELLEDEALELDGANRRGVVFERLARFADASTPMEALPAEVAFAEAMALRDRDERDGRATELLELVAERPQAGLLARDALIHLARARESEDAGRASERYLEIAERWPSVAGAAAAMQRALALARDELAERPDSARAMDRYRRVLAAALRDPTLEGREYWLGERDRLRVLRAREASADRALELIDRIEPGSTHAREALEVLEHRVLAGEGAPIGRLERAARILERHGSGRVHRVRLRLARRERDPARAAALAGALEGGAPGVAPIDATLVRAVALRAAGRAGEAFEAVRPHLDGHAEPEGGAGSDRFWALWTLALELMVEIEGADRSAARAHLARLRTLDGSLGGEAYRARLERVGNALER